MRSMTGYGRGTATDGVRKITVEMRSVNHKNLDISMKFPRLFMFCEDKFRKIAEEYVVRGHIDVFLNYEDTSDGKSVLSLDRTVAKQYTDFAEELARTGLENDLTASRLLRMPEVVTVTDSERDVASLGRLFEEAARAAFTQLVLMREEEGADMQADLEEKLTNMENALAAIEKRAPLVPTVYAEKLKKRVETYLEGVEIDQARFAAEITLYVDKVAIDEELTRLHSHFDWCRRTIKKSGSVGREFDHRAQEILREINTSGSKCNDIEITDKVIFMKNELEKFREQVQNIE